MQHRTISQTATFIVKESLTMFRSMRPSGHSPKAILTLWKYNRYKMPLLWAVILLCLLSSMLVASQQTSAQIQEGNALRVAIKQQRPIPAPIPTPTLIPTPTPTPFVAQPSPQPIPSLPANYQQQLNILQANNRLFYHGNVYLPEVALTFDDGPNPPFTSQILDVLQRYNVKASFFDVGYLAQKYPDLVQREVADGHIVGNHTWDHAHLTTLSTKDILTEINSASDELQKIIGTRPTFFRPPYGETDSHTLAAINSLGLTSFLWNNMAYDWLMPAPSVISFRVTSVARNGMIILLHDGGGDRTNTVAALSTIIPTLQARGFRFVTLRQLVDHAGG